MNVTKPNYVLNPQSPEFDARPRGGAAVAATAYIEEIVEQSEHYTALNCLFVEYQDIA